MDGRSSSHGVENPVELTNITYANQTIGSIPTLISNRKHLYQIYKLIHHSSMSFTADPGEEEEKIVKLSAAEVHKYEAEFSQLVVQFSNLQLKECIGKGALEKVRTFQQVL